MDDDRNVANFGVALVVDRQRGEPVISDGRDSDVESDTQRVRFNDNQDGRW